MAQKRLCAAASGWVNAKWALHSALIHGAPRKRETMWAKPLIVSAFVALGAFGAPIEPPRMAQFAQPGWMVPVQDRGQQDIRPLREVVS